MPNHRTQVVATVVATLVGVSIAVGALIATNGGDTDVAQAVMVPQTLLETTVAPTPPTTAAPTTTAEPTTTIALTTTTIVETTVPPTTTTTTTVPVTAPAPIPVPVAPPADTRGQEPIVELGSIEIPRIGLAASMFEGIRLTTLDRGPGHWPGTAMPGSTGNVVVAGHRTSHSKPFRHLDQLAVGDEVIFNTVDGRFVYLVTSTEIVTPDAVRIIDQTPDQTATLFACHPVGSTKQRIVIHLALATS